MSQWFFAPWSCVTVGISVPDGMDHWLNRPRKLSVVFPTFVKTSFNCYISDLSQYINIYVYTYIIRYSGVYIYMKWLILLIDAPCSPQKTLPTSYCCRRAENHDPWRHAKAQVCPQWSHGFLVEHTWPTKLGDIDIDNRTGVLHQSSCEE